MRRLNRNVPSFGQECLPIIDECLIEKNAISFQEVPSMSNKGGTSLRFIAVYHRKQLKVVAFPNCRINLKSLNLAPNSDDTVLRLIVRDWNRIMYNISQQLQLRMGFLPPSRFLFIQNLEFFLEFQNEFLFFSAGFRSICLLFVSNLNGNFANLFA
jgi:hypothetical protein